MEMTTTTQLVSQREARESIKALQGSALNTVLDHIATLHNESLANCAIANDDVRCCDAHKVRSKRSKP